MAEQTLIIGIISTGSRREVGVHVRKLWPLILAATSELWNCSLLWQCYHRRVFHTSLFARQRPPQMPELPEVETMRLGISQFAGCRIQSVAFPRQSVRPISVTPRPRTIIAKLVGRVIVAVHRYGKRIAIEIAGSECGDATHWLVIEPRMTGLLLVADAPSPQHVRMQIQLSFSSVAKASTSPLSQLLFWDRRGLGTVRLLGEPGLLAACGPERLGPDALIVLGSDYSSRLHASIRAIKVALLDQRAVAGIGNIYAAEILFLAGIDPRLPCCRLTGLMWERLATVTRELLAEAVRLKGSTLGDATYRTPNNALGEFQLQHRVYGRQGLPCQACLRPIQRIVQAQRSTFFCPQCQKRSGQSRSQ